MGVKAEVTELTLRSRCVKAVLSPESDLRQMNVDCGTKEPSWFFRKLFRKEVVAGQNFWGDSEMVSLSFEKLVWDNMLVMSSNDE